MKSQQIILVFLLAALVCGCRSQEKKAIVPLDAETDFYALYPADVKPHPFTPTELQVDKTFIENINAILFAEKQWGVLSRPSQRNFYIRFRKKDDLNYFMYVSLGKLSGGDGSLGFFEDNGYFYWFYRHDLPPNIILSKSKSEQEFLDKGSPTGLDDQMVWFLTYNSQTGEVVDVVYPHSI